MDVRAEARRLREAGQKLAEISTALGVPDSTVSRWTRDIRLTAEQHKANGKAHLRDDALNTRRADAMRASKRTAAERAVEVAHAEADAEWPTLKDDPAFMLALALYIGEGSKVGPAIGFANCDPRVLRVMLRFYRRLGVDLATVHLRNNVHAGNDLILVRDFWLQETGLGLEQYGKPTIVPARKNGNKFPMGICYIRVNNVHLRRKIDRWMDLALGTGSKV